MIVVRDICAFHGPLALLEFEKWDRVAPRLGREAHLRDAIICIGLLATLSGCVSSGVQVDPEVTARFQKGVTTKDQVIAALGTPTQRVSYPDGTSAIVYRHADIRLRPESFIPVAGLFAGGADTAATAVTLSFDAKGRLASEATTRDVVSSGYGLESN
jgi:outer membrane protein assembly factor BamE (lipoprotein component of BamABCDE complex)